MQRQLEFLAAQQRHHRLQVVALFAGDAQLVAVDLAVDLELGVLDCALDLLRQLALDALAHGDLLPRAGEVGLDVAELPEARVELPRRQSTAQEDRKSQGSGKRVYVEVGRGGRRIIKKNKN